MVFTKCPAELWIWRSQVILDMLLCSHPQWLESQVRIQPQLTLVLRSSVTWSYPHLMGLSCIWPSGKPKSWDFLPFKLLLTPLLCAYHLLNHSSFIVTGLKSRWDSTTGITEAARRPHSTTLNLTDCLGHSVFLLKMEFRMSPEVLLQWHL